MMNTMSENDELKGMMFYNPFGIAVAGIIGSIVNDAIHEHVDLMKKASDTFANVISVFLHDRCHCLS